MRFAGTSSAITVYRRTEPPGASDSTSSFKEQAINQFINQLLIQTLNNSVDQLNNEKINKSINQTVNLKT